MPETLTITDEPEQKKVLKIFMPWQEEKHQSWLEQKSLQGWQLKKVGFLYTFVRTEPRAFVYRLDYFSGSQKKRETYLDIFQQSGWELAAGFDGWYYFRIPQAAYSTDIYTDPDSRIEKLKRLEPPALMLMIVFMLLIDFDGSGFADTGEIISLILNLIILAMMIFNAVWVLAVYLKIQELEKGKEIPNTLDGK